MTLFKKVFDAHSQELDAPSYDGDQVYELPTKSAQNEMPNVDADTDELLELSELGYESERSSQLAVSSSPPALTDRAAMAQAIMKQPAPFAPPAPENAMEPAIVREPEVTPQPSALQLEPSHLSPRRSRLKTRVLGFNAADNATADPLQAATAPPEQEAQLCPCGWLAVTAGPGIGHTFALFVGVSLIGRGEDQAVSLDFGDTSISRQNHAAIAYDDELGKFYIGHGGKSNIIRLNDRPVLSTEDLTTGDVIRIGETSLRFVALCGDEFKWDPGSHDA